MTNLSFQLKKIIKSFTKVIKKIGFYFFVFRGTGQTYEINKYYKNSFTTRIFTK